MLEFLKDIFSSFNYENKKSNFINKSGNVKSKGNNNTITTTINNTSIDSRKISYSNTEPVVDKELENAKFNLTIFQTIFLGVIVALFIIVSYKSNLFSPNSENLIVLITNNVYLSVYTALSFLMITLTIYSYFKSNSSKFVIHLILSILYSIFTINIFQRPLNINLISEYFSNIPVYDRYLILNKFSNPFLVILVGILTLIINFGKVFDKKRVNIELNKAVFNYYLSIVAFVIIFIISIGSSFFILWVNISLI